MLTANAWFEPLGIDFPDFGIDNEAALKPSTCDEYVQNARILSSFSTLFLFEDSEKSREYDRRKNFEHFKVEDPIEVMKKLSGQFRGDPVDEQVLRDSLKVLSRVRSDCQELINIPVAASIADQHRADVKALNKIIGVVARFARSHNIEVPDGN